MTRSMGLVNANRLLADKRRLYNPGNGMPLSPSICRCASGADPTKNISEMAPASLGPIAPIVTSLGGGSESCVHGQCSRAAMTLSTS
ncbi:hypothetical protein BJV78DRAFT_1216250 [Lactifluus subvellereus]|nr:hypothetical protein BJV78DRAFT_1270149 [Lactifluus subvellereus]KAI0250898.1 hypothetical protein BJV78DRAFT_1216250 [Lactifluus subvellereus]